MFLQLDDQGPRYAQLIRALKAAILDGRMMAGSRLPPTRELARELALSRTTVLVAYEQLRAEGFIEGRVGSGSYVTSLRTLPASRPSELGIAPPTRYALRARQVKDPRAAHFHYDKRYNLQYCNALIDPSLYRTWGRELEQAAAGMALVKADPAGLLELRQQVCDYLARRRGVLAAPEDVLIVSGAQQAFSLTARVLLEEGDAAVLEEPHYFALRHMLSAHGANLLSVHVDDQGLICGELPVATSPRLICVTPSHQFPTGAVLSLPRRLELLRYAEQRHCWILEDDFDGEFRYDGHPLAALRSLDQGNRVIYVGSFSKPLSGAVRLGYMVLPAALRKDFTTAKYLDDIACPDIEQAALAHFMASGGFDRHLRRMHKELKARRTALVDGLRRHAGDRVEIVDVPVGMYVLVWLRGFDPPRAEALIARACERGLGLHSLAPHYCEAPPRPGVMFGYGRLSATALGEATRLFAQCLDEDTTTSPAPTTESWCDAARFVVS